MGWHGTQTETKKEIDKLKDEGKTIVFTNGCFDILHVGHIRYLTEAKRNGDVLVVAVNSDESVRIIKGEKRPIVPEAERAEMLASLTVVDFVVIFNEPTPAEVILYLKPDILIKGGDWQKNDIIGADMVESWGGKVIIAELIENASTTNIIEKVIT
ncbi:MAG: D-glycero-beta-D-manno-heptose 1-phosphate adenylyltransferase, partial [Deltaproteobacteria bacterium]